MSIPSWRVVDEEFVVYVVHVVKGVCSGHSATLAGGCAMEGAEICVFPFMASSSTRAPSMSLVAPVRCVQERSSGMFFGDSVILCN